MPGESVRPGRRRSRGPLRLRRGLFGRRIVPSTPSPEGAEAAAAAALVAAQRPGGEPVSTSHGPDGSLPAFAIDLRSPAVEVLARVVAEDSEPADPRMAPPTRKGRQPARSAFLPVQLLGPACSPWPLAFLTGLTRSSGWTVRREDGAPAGGRGYGRLAAARSAPSSAGRSRS
ncbi:DUF4259 domain-containing protein [Kitasatospora cineracea]|uniref:DUF4259 domain-containing protein n=1 Tax=Kitasatospora cineracea TaxID=88074 RepID=UPI003CC5FBFE